MLDTFDESWDAADLPEPDVTGWTSYAVSFGHQSLQLVDGFL
jgi:hypothetical protein